MSSKAPISAKIAEAKATLAKKEEQLKKAQIVTKDEDPATDAPKPKPTKPADK